MSASQLFHNAYYVPAGYSVVRVGFQMHQAVAPCGTDLGMFQFASYAANRCVRHAHGLSY